VQVTKPKIRRADLVGAHQGDEAHCESAESQLKIK